MKLNKIRKIKRYCYWTNGLHTISLIYCIICNIRLDRGQWCSDFWTRELYLYFFANIHYLLLLWNKSKISLMVWNSDEINQTNKQLQQQQQNFNKKKLLHETNKCIVRKIVCSLRLITDKVFSQKIKTIEIGKIAHFFSIVFFYI